MDSKTANRNVNILNYVIDTKVRDFGKDATFDKTDIFNKVSGMSERTYRDSMDWFCYREIFERIGSTSKTKYKLHPNFKYKISKSKETIKKQCYFIIGQLAAFSEKIYDEAESLYKDVVLNTTLFDFLPTIKESVVKKTLATTLVAIHNETNKGDYPYELLLRLTQLKSPFEIDILTNQMTASIKSIKLKSIKFNTDSITLQFNDAKFNLDNLNQIKRIHIPIKSDIRKDIDASLEILKSYDKENVNQFIEFLQMLQTREDVFFQYL